MKSGGCRDRPGFVDLDVKRAVREVVCFMVRYFKRSCTLVNRCSNGRDALFS